MHTSISGSGTGVGPQAGVGSPGGIAAPASSHATRAISDAAASSTAASLAETCPLDAKSELAIDASESRTLEMVISMRGRDYGETEDGAKVKMCLDHGYDF